MTVGNDLHTHPGVQIEILAIPWRRAFWSPRQKKTDSYRAARAL